MGLDLAGMGRVAEGMSDMRDRMDAQRMNMQQVEGNAVRLRKLQQDEADRQQAYQDNMGYARNLVVGADGVTTTPIQAPVAPAAPAAPAPVDSGGYMPTSAPAPRAAAPATPAAPVPTPAAPTGQARLTQLQQRQAGTMPGAFYNTANPNTGKSIADDVLAGYDQAAPALMYKFYHGLHLTPQEQQVLGNAPSTPADVRSRLTYTPIASGSGTGIPSPVALSPQAARPVSAPAAAPAPAGAVAPSSLQIPAAVQAQRDAQAGQLIAANEYGGDASKIANDLAMVNAELGKRGLNAEARSVLQQEQTRLQAALTAAGSAMPQTTGVTSPAPVPASATPAATPMALDPNGQYATVASTSPDADRLQRAQEAQFLQLRMQHTHDPAVQQQIMGRLLQLKTEDDEANIYHAYAGAKVGSPDAWQALAGLVHQQTGSQVGFYSKDGQVAMYRQGADGRPEVLDQGPLDQMAGKLYAALSPAMRARAMGHADEVAKAEAQEAPKRITEAMKATAQSNTNLAHDLTRIEVAKIMANAKFRSVMAAAKMSANNIKGISRDPIQGNSYVVYTNKGVFKYVPGQSDGDITSPDRLVPIAGDLGTTGVPMDAGNISMTENDPAYAE